VRLASCPVGALEATRRGGNPVRNGPSAAPDWRERGAPWPSLATPNLCGHCDRSDVTVASLPAALSRVTPSFSEGGILPPSNRCAPKQGLHIGTWIARRRPFPTLLATSRPPMPMPAAWPDRQQEERKTGDLRRSDADLCRLRSGVHSFGGRPGVLRTEGVLVGPQALRELSSQPPRQPRRRLRRPRHWGAARLRARRRPRRSGVLRGHLLIVRKSSASPVQATHGPTRVLLRLLPAGETRLNVEAAADCPPLTADGEGSTVAYEL
jgi:hypothetical protein